MAAALCDVCKIRPATVRVRIARDGQEQVLNLCDVDYARLRQSEDRAESPFESLFGGGGIFDDMFERLAGTADAGSAGEAAESGSRRLPVRRRRTNREAVDVADYLSEQTKELLQRAAQLAAEWGKREVDTEHLLYVLADNEVAQAIFKQFRIAPQDIKTELEKTSPHEKAAAEAREIGVSPRVKSALVHAFEASRELGHSYVGQEHLLIGLAEEQDGIAGDLLRRYGLTPQALRQQTVKVVGAGAEEGRVEAPTNTPTLDKYSRDLTQLARQGKLDPVIGRAKEIETTIEVLARRKKNNPVLIGEPGVGKTAIVEGLAQRVVNHEVPEVLRDKRIVELNVNSLIAGSKYRGEFEERIKHVLEEVTSHSDQLVIFIDEVHTIVGAGSVGGEGGVDIANVFKPALARGELHLIGATTLNEYQKHIERDAALERRFQPVLIAEPTLEQTINILHGLRDRFEAHHKVRISDEAIVAAAELSDRYITGRYLPDKAIDLIDQAAARVRIASSSRPAEVLEMESQLQQQRREHDYATSRKQTDRAKELADKIQQRERELAQATERWKRTVGSGSVEVAARHVAEIVSALTGIPVSELTAEEREKLINLEKRLHERVVGQEEAVRAVSDAVRLARAGLKERGHPIATFLFLGPTGVGKTELARSLAWAVFGDEDAVVRIDMSEYMERHTVSRLIGAPPGYVGYEEGGQLTERVRRRPYSVVLLDEIEKAHPDVHNVLLQVFDDGRLTDGKGRVVDFTNTMIICTSNLGSDLIQRRLQGKAATHEDYERLKRDLMEVVRRHFRPEFINRIDEVIVFHALNRDDIKAIVLLQLERVRRMALGQGITLEFDDSLVDHLTEVGYQPEFGARELKRRIRSEVETRLAKAMMTGEVQEGQTARLRYDSDRDAVVITATGAPRARRAEPRAAVEGGKEGRPRMNGRASAPR
jgi:ATP-dependent Clp protease ATP-binding subunit ClpC